MSPPQPVTTPSRAADPTDPLAGSRSGRFEVHLENFDGPFDLLLGLIAKHQLDVTEVALSQVTDDFIGYIRRAGSSWDLGAATEFLVVASTLLDLKTARLLPAAEAVDEADLALLEARDLLFARLLQYRAYKQAAAYLASLERSHARRFARTATLEPRFLEALPEVLLGIGSEQLAVLAAAALTPKAPPAVGVGHLHVPQVSVREHEATLRSWLARSGAATFRSLVADCGSTLEIVARFLALLEMHRSGVVAFEQLVPLGELHVRWTGDRSRFRSADAEASDTPADPREEIT